MAKFLVRIKETLIREVLVAEAENATEAQEKVEARYNNEEIVLDAEDDEGAEFETEEITEEE